MKTTINPDLILYICTGLYKEYFSAFRSSLDAHLVSSVGYEVAVFTDDPDYFCTYKDDPRVRIVQIKQYPWPAITLFRYQYFLWYLTHSKSTYRNCIFFNSNAQLAAPFNIDSLLDGVDFLSVEHPGFISSTPQYFPLERSLISSAYIPFGREPKVYSQGFLVGGNSQAFMRMCKTIAMWLLEDLGRKNYPIFHDESYQNKYFIQEQVNYLPPAYAAPEEMLVVGKTVVLSRNKPGAIQAKKNDPIQSAINRFYQVSRRLKMPIVCFRKTKSLEVAAADPYLCQFASKAS
ncbi:hypothetical protein G6737_08920 [Polynucleobacter paneuropaeus]|jgi:histo-blood group ABO system transferase|nr:hypothetical protein [Polynucleobacter paneuropaeus]MBT8539681.1 hypothetical protein [Polynucleobacter paneuropaeus]